MALLPPDPKYLLRGDMDCVHSLLFLINPYIEYLFAGTAKGKVYIWDLKRNRIFKQFTAGENSCLSLRSINENDLITQMKTGEISIWKGSESQWVLHKTMFNDCCSFCRCQVLSEDILLVPLRDSAIGFLSLKTNNVEIKLDPSELSWPGPFGEVMAMKPLILEGNQYVLVAYESGHLILWDLKQRRGVSYLKNDTCPMAIDFNKHQMQGILGDNTDKVQVFAISADHQLSDTNVITVKTPGTSVLVVRPDAKVFTAGGWDGRLRIFSCKSRRQLVTLDQHKGTIHDIIYSSSKVESYDSNCLMAAAGKDGYISLWDLYN